MPTITIPEEHAGGLARIMELSSEESQRVVGALEKVQSLNIRDLTTLVHTSLPSLAVKDAIEVVRTLLSLYSARTGMDMRVEAFVTELIAAAKQIQTEKAQPKEILEKNLSALLSVRPLSMISKARSIHTSYENTFCTVRIITDLRPVWDVDVTEAPVGFVIAHMLNLGYHHAGEHTSLNIAMDRIDVETLMQTLLRAKEKAATLTATITGKSSGFPILAD